MTFPSEFSVFELTLDADAPRNHPLEMVRRDGYENHESWRFTGPRLAGQFSGRFKLVSIGTCDNLVAVRRKLCQYGQIPTGQWREAFIRRFRRPYKEQRPVGFADGSWIYPSGDRRFPMISSQGATGFGLAAWGCDETWLWLVEVR